MANASYTNWVKNVIGAVSSVSDSDSLALTQGSVTKRLSITQLSEKVRSSVLPSGGTTGQVLAKTSGTDYAVQWVDQSGGGGGSGTVTTLSVATANGFAGSVSNPTTTPVISLTTSVSGIIKGSGSALTAAVAGTDYEVPLTFGTGLTRNTNAVTVNTTQNITKLSNLTGNGLVKTSGGDGSLSIATAGTDYQSPVTLTTTGFGVATFNSNVLNIPTPATTEERSLFLPEATDREIVITSSARYGFTINQIHNLKTSSGSVNLAVKINGTNVTGLESVAVTSSAGNPSASAANTVAVGDRVTILLSASSSALNFEGTLRTTRTS